MKWFWLIFGLLNCDALSDPSWFNISDSSIKPDVKIESARKRFLKEDNTAQNPKVEHYNIGCENLKL